MNKNIRLVVYGFFIWLIPFAIAFLFYNKQGDLLINALVFKSVMVVVGTITGAAFLVAYFYKIKKDYLNEGVIAGIVWFFMNIVLDILTLVLLFGKPIMDYVSQIGLGYLAIPAMCIAMGYILSEKVKK